MSSDKQVDDTFEAYDCIYKAEEEIDEEEDADRAEDDERLFLEMVRKQTFETRKRDLARMKASLEKVPVGQREDYLTIVQSMHEQTEQEFPDLIDQDQQ
jgi:hypothetical protein